MTQKKAEMRRMSGCLSFAEAPPSADSILEGGEVNVGGLAYFEVTIGK